MRSSLARHRQSRNNVRYRIYHLMGGDGHQDRHVKILDGALVALICLNCIFSILETVEHLAIVHGHIFHGFDVLSVLIFTVEYGARVWTAPEIPDPRYRHPLWGRVRYMLTPLALIDLVAILPFYLGMFVTLDLRAMRVLRLMRVFKLTRYSQAMNVLLSVLRNESRALGAMLFIFCVILIFVSSVMYLFEHPHQPHIFSDIPSSMWWAVVTMTTLGYGDMVPMSAAGRLLGACTALIGVGMIAMPAGVLASGFSEALRLRREEYLETAEKILHDGTITRQEKRALEEMRLSLGLSQEEAAHLLQQAHRVQASHCPHCGLPLPPVMEEGE